MIELYIRHFGRRGKVGRHDAAARRCSRPAAGPAEAGPLSAPAQGSLQVPAGQNEPLMRSLLSERSRSWAGFIPLRRISRARRA